MSDDQDFFFDEEETPAEKPERGAQAPSASSRSKSVSRSAAAPAVASAERTVTVTITALVGVVALLAGIIIGVLIPTGDGGVPAPTATNQPAPQLSEEQLQGGLPAGHPDISSAGGSTTPTGTGAATETTAP